MEEFLWMQGVIYQMYAVEEEEELLELYNARSELVRGFCLFFCDKTSNPYKYYRWNDFIQSRKRTVGAALSFRNSAHLFIIDIVVYCIMSHDTLVR
jgi:hypothetical protein